MASTVCVVSGTICNVDGTAGDGVEVRARIEQADDDGGQLVGGAGVASSWCSAFTDSAGAFSIDLIQGARVLIEVPAINLRKTILVPNTTSANLSDLI